MCEVRAGQLVDEQHSGWRGRAPEGGGDGIPQHIELHRDRRIPDTIRFLRFPRSALVGRHQALAREIHIDWCQSNGVEIARRITGGGAIWFEPAHLGWELVLPRSALGPSLDAAFTAQVAITRRNGQLTDAAADLAAGWTASQPVDGWSPYLPAEPTPTSDTAVTSPGESAARAVLAQWRQAATPPPTPVMT